MTETKSINCFNFIRLLATLQVFFGHALLHLDIAVSPIVPLVLRSFQGVPVFFIMSGFLIWNSLERTPRFNIYVKKRVLRLYPELWLGVLLSALSIIVLYGSKIEWKSFIAFLLTQSTVLQFWTPNSLRGFGCGTPNGALWTIGVMVQSYLAIWIIYKKLHKSNFFHWLTLLIPCTLINIATPFLEALLPTIIYKLFLQTFIVYFWMFLIGAMICEYLEKVSDFLKKYWYILFILSAIFTFTGFDRGIYGTIKVYFLAFAVVGFAYKFKNIRVQPDISYGLYIYHMVVINIMMEMGYMGKWLDILLALAVSGLLAMVSYLTIGNLSKKQKSKLYK
ncbi:hypothetical protein HMPREF1020_02680 [Clostridium sp. 7_3_54FAA]|nr:hypothetical protein HMPREF1020_02680 [Clostridium sp. 7_3_54FAA]